MLTQTDLDKLVLTAIANADRIYQQYLDNFLGESDEFPYSLEQEIEEVEDAESA
jgi:hypothetical protein